MPKAQVVLRQLLRYGLPAIALSAAGSFSLVLLSGNTYIIDLFNDWDWFNTNHIHLPNGSQPANDPDPIIRPDSQVPNIHIQLPTVSVDPELNVTTPVTITPNVNIDPNLNFTPNVDLQFNPELNPEITVSPTLEFNPELSSDFGFAPSLEFDPQVTVSPSFQNSSERPIILTNPDRLFNAEPSPIPTRATVPEARTQPPEPTVSAVPNAPTQLPKPKLRQKSPNSLQQSNTSEEESENTPDEPEFNFQLPEDEMETTPETPIITFDPEELPPDLRPQPPTRKDFLPGVKDLPTVSTRSSSPHYSTDPSDKVVSVPEPRMVMTILLFGLGLFGFKKKR